jgi:hypothetical protein
VKDWKQQNSQCCQRDPANKSAHLQKSARRCRLSRTGASHGLM